MISGGIAIWRMSSPRIGVRRPDELDPFYEQDDILFGYREDKLIGSGVMTSVRIDVSRRGAPKDCDGDTARLARFEVQATQTDLWDYPNLEISGWLPEWTAQADFPDDYNPSARGSYVPEPDPDWKPGFVMVRLYPKVA